MTKTKTSTVKKRTIGQTTQTRGASVDLAPIAPLIERIVANLKPEEVWLFGSRPEGRSRPGSDFDLLAVLPDDSSESDLDLISAWKLTCDLGIAADLVPCTRSEFEDEKKTAWARWLLPRITGECASMSDKRKQAETKKARLRALLHLAEQDVKAVMILAKDGNHYAAFHCQQAAEKLIRVLLIHHEIEPGIGHHLDVLVAQLPDSEPWKVKVGWMHKYTPYATTFRYATPGGRVPATPDAVGVIADAKSIAELISEAMKQFVDSAMR